MKFTICNSRRKRRWNSKTLILIPLFLPTNDILYLKINICWKIAKLIFKLRDKNSYRLPSSCDPMWNGDRTRLAKDYHLNTKKVDMVEVCLHYWNDSVLWLLHNNLIYIAMQWTQKRLHAKLLGREPHNVKRNDSYAVLNQFFILFDVFCYFLYKVQ